jgi:predicted nucleic acid-binding protein
LSEKPDRLRIFIDADVLFAGSASPTGASHLVLELAELGIIEAIVSDQVRREVERNLMAKLPAALPAFRALVDACCRNVADPDPAASRALAAADLADPKDAPILAAALEHLCSWLLTFNLRDYRPQGRIQVALPGDFLVALRERLAEMSRPGHR